MKRIILLLLLPLVFVRIANAQVDEITYLSIENGLSNNSVNTIFKDKYGYMWFGTDDGLNRYDGYEFKVFRNNKKDPSSVAFNRISCIASEENGDLWVGTKNGLSIYNNFSSKFHIATAYSAKTRKNIKVDSEINAIVKDENHGLWVGTNKQGLLYKALGKPLLQISPSFKNGLLSNYNIIAVSVGGPKVWFVIEDVGLCVFNSQSQEMKIVSTQFSMANCLYKANDEILWIGNGKQLYRYNTLTKSVISQKSLSGERVIRPTEIKKSRNGEIWVATDGGGISILDSTGTETRKITANAIGKNLNSNAVMAVFFDNEDRIWMGTLRGGVNIIDKRKNKFKTVAHDRNNTNSLINDFVLSFCEDHNGRVWVGTDGGGLSVWNRKTNDFKNYVHESGNEKSLSNNNVTSIVEDRDGNIWIGTFGAGIDKFNPKNQSFEHFKCKHPTGEDYNIWKLYCDSKNNIWAGTTFGNNYTYKLNKTRGIFEVAYRTLDHVITIAEDKNNVMWFGTESGKLTKVDPLSEKLISYKFKHPIRSISFSNDETIWLGVQYTGLIHLNPTTKTFKTFTETEGLCNNSVLSIQKDEDQNFWISTFNGVSKFNLKTAKFTNFYEADGLQSNQFTYNAAITLTDGTILFGGIRGFNYFNPKKIAGYKSFPTLLITDLDVMNKTIALKQNATSTSNSLARLNNLTVKYDNAAININYAALEYSAPSKIQYAYYLEGWDKVWTYTSFRSAYYSKLTEGTYTFHLKSTNAEGEWNNAEKLITIKVLPPWFRSIWAYLVYLLGLVGAIFVYNRYRVRQAELTYELGINKVKAEKEAEINESKFAFFTNISHEFRTPLTLIINPVKDLLRKDDLQNAGESLQTILKNSRRLLNLIDQLLLFRKVESDTYRLQVSKFDLQMLCEDAFACFKSEALLHHIDYELTGILQTEIYVDREKIEIILFNLLGNAIKYTPSGGKVTLKLAEKDNYVSISVEDTGTGIAEEHRENLFKQFYQAYPKSGKRQNGFGIGLYLVKRFVELHGGNVRVTDNEPKGSIFTVELKKGNSHFGSDVTILETHSKYTPLENLDEDEQPDPIAQKGEAVHFSLSPITSDKKSILVVDDNEEMRNYLVNIFKERFKLFEARDGDEALKVTRKHFPDLIISDVMMDNLNGLELCETIKKDPAISHIPIILLTASASSESKLRGIKGGADDYISKPFDVEMLNARVEAMLKSRDDLNQYIFNEIGNSESVQSITEEQKDFLNACSEFITSQLQNPNFGVDALADKMGMSHSNLYKKIKASSGQSATAFIRFVRLRKAAEILVYTDSLVNEAALACGINDIKYFRKHFTELFGMQPSAFVKKYRPTFKKKFRLDK